MLDKEPEDWRELLAQITSDSAGMHRIMQELGVRDITIKRWIKGESEPRHQNLRRLLNALPEHREHFLAFFSEVFKDFSDLALDEAHQEISPRFYTQIFQMRSTISRAQRYWSLANLIISQALTQLDPEGLGMAITIVRCMLPATPRAGATRIFSLRESVGLASAPWPGNLEQLAMFLGAESLAGCALENCRPAEVQSYDAEPHGPLGHQLEHEASSIAHPILCAGKVAGCLLFSSREPLYFQPPARQNLVSDYAHLIALAFDQEDFVDPAAIELRIMPPHTEQQRYFANFRRRLSDARYRLYEQGQMHVDAEQYVWEELEKEILGI
jgi:hypothetical protein